MLRKLAAAPNGAAVVVASLDLLVEPLRATICATLKDNAVKQQVERHEELTLTLPLTLALTLTLTLTRSSGTRSS